MQDYQSQETQAAEGSGNIPPSQPSEIAPTIATDNDDARTQQLLTWLDLPTAREQRRYLESHCHLLDIRSETILHDLLGQAAERPEQTQRLHTALMLLQDARARGGTVQAVREAYINLYSGFVLDLPPWLEAVEQRLTDLLKENRHNETAEERVALLREALEPIQMDIAYTPELLATLRRELAEAWLRHQRTNRIQALETAITLCKEVLCVYTLTCYPHQYAKTQNYLGNVYEMRIAGKRRENLEQAIACYQEALQVQTLDAFPFEYAKVQNNLGLAYGERIAGERRENLEQAIVCYHEALRVWTFTAFPIYYAIAQNNLGLAYWERIAGERRENLEQAIACYQEALRVRMLDTFHFEYAKVQNNLGLAYGERIAGERRENLEQAIVCYHEALRVWTLDAFPFNYAMVHGNLGEAYGKRIAGERRANLEQAIACCYEALRVWTVDAFPFYYAGTQIILGDIHRHHIVGGRQTNLEQAISCYQEALRVYTLEAFPRESRDARLNLAEIEAQRENWIEVQNAYRSALEAENLLVILGAGTAGRDAAIRLGYALYRLGYVGEAAVAMERGRARGLAEAMELNAADPALITDEERRTRYIAARESLIKAQADLHALSSQNLDEETRRRLDLAHTAAYRQARATFDALVAEIRAAQDPADFLNAPLDATTILHAPERIGSAHALVYLAATPWGGVAVAALNTHPKGSSAGHFAALDLPDLTEAFVNTLIETRLNDGSEAIIGGFSLAQMGESFERLLEQWDGETLQARIKAFHAACRKVQQESTLDNAAQQAMTRRPFARLGKRPIASLNAKERSLLSATLDQIFLQYELDRCLDHLSKTVMQPLVAWLHEQGVVSLTLIPCGHLATFPLATVVLANGRSVGETLPTSLAPSARSLLHQAALRSPQAGISALGDPHYNLPWSEAEALTLTALARRYTLPAEAHVKRQATRDRLLSAFGNRWMVDASCHGTFDQEDFLRSALHLAQGGRITMSEMLSHQADLRGLRLLLLSACQTALLDLQGARDEVHSLAAAMVQAGAQAVLAAQWAVDDKATYLLMVRFAQEWLPRMDLEPPAAALARAQHWLRTVTNAELASWHSTIPTSPRVRLLTRSMSSPPQPGQSAPRKAAPQWQHLAVRGRHARYLEDEAQLVVRIGAQERSPSVRPYADPYYWAGFQVIGW